MTPKCWSFEELYDAVKPFNPMMYVTMLELVRRRPKTTRFHLDGTIRSSRNKSRVLGRWWLGRAGEGWLFRPGVARPRLKPWKLQDPVSLWRAYQRVLSYIQVVVSPRWKAAEETVIALFDGKRGAVTLTKSNGADYTVTYCPDVRGPGNEDVSPLYSSRDTQRTLLPLEDLSRAYLSVKQSLCLEYMRRADSLSRWWVKAHMIRGLLISLLIGRLPANLRDREAKRVAIVQVAEAIFYFETIDFEWKLVTIETPGSENNVIRLSFLEVKSE